MEKNIQCHYFVTVNPYWEVVTLLNYVTARRVVRQVQVLLFPTLIPSWPQLINSGKYSSMLLTKDLSGGYMAKICHRKEVLPVSKLNFDLSTCQVGVCAYMHPV